MTLRTRLTLSSVALVASMAGVISVFYLGNEVQKQFQNNLERSELMNRLAGDAVRRSRDRSPKASIYDALSNDEELSGELVDIMASSHVFLDIHICDPRGKILSSTDTSSVGTTAPNYPDFRLLATGSGWVDKIRVLLGRRRNYQLVQALGEEGQEAASVSVRSVIYPSLIRQDIQPELGALSVIFLYILLGSVLVALVVARIAFRPLDQVGQMLDRLTAEGDAATDPAPVPRGEGEFAEVASKVSLLGQKLRGVTHDYSELRGNVERLLNELEDTVLVFGRDRRLVVASGAVEKFMGRSRTELMGQLMGDVFPPNTSLGLLLAQIDETGRQVRNRRISLNSNSNSQGKLSQALLSVDILETVGMPASGVVTKRAGLLVRLRDPEPTRQLGRQLQTAERLTNISQITAGVAHEVKNPLNAILIHVELARMKLAAGDCDLGPQMDIIAREILRLDRVVKTFLDFTRPVELNVTEVALDSFISEMMELARPQAAAAGIELVPNPRGANASICGDVDLLKQAVLNVVVNAIEAMPNGGELRLESLAHGEEAEIRISDTGSGIPPDVRDKIFKLYFTTKKEGSGIGLALTFRVVQLHDGTIEFFSEPGQGTTFVLRFPVAVGSC